MTLSSFFTVSSEIKSPQKRPLRVKWYLPVKTVEKVKTLRERDAIFRYTRIAYLFKDVASVS
jgi:hypothetical protein